jgi:hypothetical protein
MNRKNFEVGVQRLYYAGWLAWASVLLFVDGKPDLGMLLPWFALCVVAPAVAMFVTRWIYRGFMPKTDSR